MVHFQMAEISKLYLERAELDSQIKELEIYLTTKKEKRAVTDKKFYMEKALLTNLNFLIIREIRKWDNLLIIDGDERAGKSTLGRQIGYFKYYSRYKNNPAKLQDYYDCKNIFFDPYDVLDFARNTTNEVIIWDEAALGGLSEDRFNEVQQILIKLLMVCGKFGHFLIFIIPKMKRLSAYFIEDRAIGLIRITTVGNLHRGHFSGYGRKKMVGMYGYEKGKTRYKPFPDFRGAFLSYEGTDKEVIDLAKYEAKKDYAINNLSFAKRRKDNLGLYLAKVIDLIKSNKWAKKKEIAEYLDVSSSFLSNLPTIKKNPLK